MKHAARRISARAFTLIEAVTVVLVLAIAVPPAVVWLNEAVSARADAVNAARATALATAVTEHIIADCSSESAGLGFAALAAAPAYLSTPNVGLYARLEPVTSLYQPMGFSYTVAIGPLVDKTAVISNDAARNVFRVVTVTVEFRGATGGKLQLVVSAMLSGATS